MERIILSIALLGSFLILANDAFSQEPQLSEKDKKKLEKEEKKKQKEAVELAEWNEAKTMAESKRFVFTANEMYTADGSISLDSRTNFFYVIGDDATLQFTFIGLQGIPNPNGLGGITSKGRVTKYSYKADNYKKPVTIEVTVNPLAGQGRGIHQMVVTIFGEGYAELLMPGNGARLKGRIVKPEDSKIYEGTQL